MPDSLNYPKTPSVVEVVLGVQFSPLAALTSGHYGLFWNRLGDQWIKSRDTWPIDDQYEDFENPSWTILSQKSVIGPMFLPSRFQLENKNRDRMIQMQPSRFHLNWQRAGDDYPGFPALMSEFVDHFGLWNEFVGKTVQEELRPNLWEITYIDAFPLDKYNYDHPGQWSRILPGLFSPLFTCPNHRLEIDNRAGQWSFEIHPQLGRLRVTAQAGRWRDSKHNELLLHMTARGPANDYGSMVTGIELGHDVILESFQKILAPEILATWSKK